MVGVTLPNGYKQVEYLESDGGAYFDIPVSIAEGETFKAEIKFQYTGERTTNFWVAGDGVQRDGTQFEFGYWVSNWYYFSNASYNVISGNHPNRIMEASAYKTYAQNVTLYFRIFQRYGFTPEQDSRRVWYVKLYLDDTLIRNLIPCYRISDDKPGMYDLVSNTFFTNSGTGEFRMPPRLSMMAIRRRILANTPHVESVSGSGSVQFSTDMSVGLKDCRIYFTPIQEGSGTPSPDNVRPITGWDGIDITKNIGQDFYKYNVLAASVQTTVTKINDNSFRMYCTNKNYPASKQNASTLNIVNGKQYLIEFDAQINSIVEGHRCMFGFRNSSNTYQADARVPIYTSGHYQFSFTYYNTRMSYLSLCEDSGQYVAVDVTISNLKLYELETLTIPFPRTIYGGYLDLVRGEVVEIGEKFQIDGTETGWRSLGTGSADHRFDLPVERLQGQVKTVSNDWISDMFLRNAYNPSFGYFTFYSNVSIIFRDTNAVFATVDDFKSWLSENNPSFYAPLATPTHIPLTDPPTIKTLKGINSLISSANGNIQISYFTHITT